VQTSPFFPLQRRGIVLKDVFEVRRFSELPGEKYRKDFHHTNVRKEFDCKRTSPLFPLQRRGIFLKILVAGEEAFGIS